MRATGWHHLSLVSAVIPAPKLAPKFGGQFGGQLALD